MEFVVLGEENRAASGSVEVDQPGFVDADSTDFSGNMEHAFDPNTGGVFDLVVEKHNRTILTFDPDADATAYDVGTNL